MNEQRAQPASFNTRGAVFRLFGVILVILGTLDAMLAWRGGYEVVPFYAMLIVGGLLLCLVGAIRNQGGREDQS